MRDGLTARQVRENLTMLHVFQDEQRNVFLRSLVDHFRPVHAYLLSRRRRKEESPRAHRKRRALLRGRLRRRAAMARTA